MAVAAATRNRDTRQRLPQLLCVFSLVPDNNRSASSHLHISFFFFFFFCFKSMNYFLVWFLFERFSSSRNLMFSFFSNFSLFFQRILHRIFGRITRYLHPLFLHSSYFRTRESFPLVSYFLFFFFVSVPFSIPLCCSSFFQHDASVFFFHRCDYRFLFLREFLSFVCALRARKWDRKKGCARIRACMFVFVNSYQFFFLLSLSWSCCHIHALVRIVCVSLRVRVSVMVSDRKKGGAERGKEQGRSICV